MIALYDMRHRLSTYDYFTWQVVVQLLGATHVCFRTHDMKSTKWPVDEARRRFLNYIWPAPELSGLGKFRGEEGVDVGSHKMEVLRDLIEERGDFKRLTSVLSPRHERYTVTIRDTFHNKHKNSDRELWLEFARRINAHVIDDTSKVRISLHERVALYAGARMNFGVTNGPMSMLWYTPYPMCMICDPVATKKGFNGHDIQVDEQISWLLPNQRLVWEPQSMDVLMREWERVEHERK